MGRGFGYNRNESDADLVSPDGLIKTGPTHTNVCDVRVVVVEQSTQEQRP